MKVSIYLDYKGAEALAELCIASVRKHMPHAEIWHLTTEDGPELSADKCLRMDIQGTYGYKRNALTSMLEGEVISIDYDVIMQEDISSVFDEDFELGVTVDMKPGGPGIKYNGGVIFSRSQEYWKTIAEIVKDMDFCKTEGDWYPIELACNQLADSGKFKTKVFSSEYNHVPSSPEDKQGKLIHYRGKRKAWVFPITEFQSKLNTEMAVMISQAEQNLSRDLPLFVEHSEHAGVSLIVGGAPSLTDELKNLRTHTKRGGVIFALNGAHDWLIEHGIIPDYHVLLDARKENAEFVRKPHKGVTYLVAAQCHPEVFNALEGHKVMMWAACLESAEQEKAVCDKFPKKPIGFIGGGATVGLKTMNLAYLLGFRKIRLYGMDSSYSGSENHAYRQELNDKESKMEIHAAGKDFICAPWMAKQATEFQRQYRQLVKLGCKIKVLGYGLIPHIYQQIRNT